MKKKLIGSLIVLIGIVIIITPKVMEIRSRSVTEEIVDIFEERTSIKTVSIKLGEYQESDDILKFDGSDEVDLSELSYDSPPIIDEKIIKEKAKELNRQKEIDKQKELEIQKELDKKKKEEEAKRKKETLILERTEALLTIDAIKLKMPILTGASLDNLSVSISSISGTGKPWTEGNYAIAGHRSRTYGKDFNRLGDLANGHEILITDLEGNDYRYKIFSVKIVHETEVDVLDDYDKKTVTLITCHPLYEKNPPERLIVVGKLLE